MTDAIIGLDTLQEKQVPYKYAIKVETKEVTGLDYYGDETYKTTTEYPLTPKDFADTHKDGMKMLVSATGFPLTGWVPIKRNAYDLTSIKRSSQFPAITDLVGAQLTVGDYVVTHYRKMDNLQVCEIIGFVKQGKARLLPVGNFEQSHGILRFPREMVQIIPTVLGDDPNGEWIPTEEDMF